MSATTAASASTEVKRELPKLGDVDACREHYRRHVLPRGYSPRLHVAAHVVSVLGGAAVALAHVHEPRALEWLAIPAGLVAGSLLEYLLHRYAMHRPLPGMRFAFERHAIHHHRFFTYERSTRDEPGDLHVLLFPWQSGAPLIAGSWLLALALRPLVGQNAAFLSMLIGVLYFGLYEGVHAVCHLPDAHPLTRVPPLRLLREHHRLHHDPALMGRHNFNVVLPIFDWLFGTLVTSRRSRD